jgi:DNA-binding NarL/FixJ family response regulator
MRQLWIIEDDPRVLEAIGTLLRQSRPDLSISLFASCIEAFRSTGSPDLILADVGGLGSHCSTPATLASPIANLAAQHPGAHLVVTSAMLPWAAAVVDELREILAETIVMDVCKSDVRSLCSIVGDLLPAEASS